MAFLILLTLAAGALMVLLMGLVGLLEAPWPVLLGGLLLALYGLQRLSVEATKAEESVAFSAVPSQAPPAHEPKSPSPSSQSQADTESATPELVYRGVHYRRPSAPALPTEGQPIVLEGTYRGRHWRRILQQWSTPTASPPEDQPPS
ncbi:hypothetical protein XM38_038170 [Halomicronema hongdechloris C2206]|uniref:DUF4278 domain-containing protein n=1 Tax=Halomicronema hongdechloris C2206 TaxID=1641165 RepID=A0A1Z3HRV3_9CYAN|nr:DUF4278 domain-containing protein [Halomicronema hongdechloris]ASC72857.1 hypothetical protein XM38_038170 [Halomicronema hongdechloris C2206]